MVRIFKKFKKLVTLLFLSADHSYKREHSDKNENLKRRSNRSQVTSLEPRIGFWGIDGFVEI